MESNKPYENSDLLLKVIHNFVRFTASAESYPEVFWAITKNFMYMLQIEDCVVYEAFPKELKIVQRAAHGAKNPNGETINNLLILDYGTGIAGWVAQHQKTVCVPDTRADKRYIVDDERRLSELCVPILFNGELFGVISSENSELDYFSAQHIQLFELIADLAANLLVRIRQKQQLDELSDELESLYNEKKQALEKAIETVSYQVNEIKYQKDKQDVLLREVHHRVNNNLQLLNSIVNLYLAKNKHINYTTLEEIKRRIQTLSSIHLILLKSMENNKNSVQDFLHDLIAAIRYMNPNNYLVVNLHTTVPTLSLNTLIPLGLLIHELIEHASYNYWKKGEQINLNLTIEYAKKNTFELQLTSLQELHLIVQENQNPVSSILIDSLIEQLDGQNLKIDSATNIWKINFCNLE